MTATSRKSPPRPWPMKWIVIAIATFAVGYTVVNFYFRKPGRAYRPYQDAQDRATTARLLAAGWHKIPVETRRPLEAPGVGLTASVRRELAGLGPDLESKFAEKPRLVSSVERVVAPAIANLGDTCTVYLTLNHSNLKTQVGEIALYHHDREIVLIPALENLPGHDLMSRWQDATYAVTFSTAPLSRGRYVMRAVSLSPAATWNFDIH